MRWSAPFVNFARAMVEGSTFSGNAAPGPGITGSAAAAIHNDANLAVRNSTFVGNSGGDGTTLHGSRAAASRTTRATRRLWAAPSPATARPRGAAVHNGSTVPAPRCFLRMSIVAGERVGKGRGQGPDLDAKHRPFQPRLQPDRHHRRCHGFRPDRRNRRRAWIRSEGPARLRRSDRDPRDHDGTAPRWTGCRGTSARSPKTSGARGARKTETATGRHAATSVPTNAPRRRRPELCQPNRG